MVALTKYVFDLTTTTTTNLVRRGNSHRRRRIFCSWPWFFLIETINAHGPTFHWLPFIISLCSENMQITTDNFFLKRTDFVYLYCFNFMISQNKETTFLDFVERTKSFLNCDCVELKAYLGLSILIYTYISAFRISCGCDFQWTFLLNRKNKQEKENLNLVLRLINLEHFQCKKKN